MTDRLISAALAAALGLLATAPAHAQGEEGLAKQLANPISSLISVPFQLNYDTGFGTEDAERFLLNVQPVIPFSLNEDWNVISRTIVPVVGQDAFFQTTDSRSGLGDTVQSFFFSPKASVNGVTWGVGPVFLLPTATEDELGSEKWGVGPTGVVLRQAGPWTVGALANHIWSVAGDDDRADVNATFVQPFLSYTTAAATTFVVNTEASYDWEQEQWAVPINAAVNQLVTFGDQPVQIGAGVRYWADAPEFGPEGWGARINVTFLLPK